MFLVATGYILAHWKKFQALSTHFWKKWGVLPDAPILLSQNLDFPTFFRPDMRNSPDRRIYDAR
jgi:hypothetical protein